MKKYRKEQKKSIRLKLYHYILILIGITFICFSPVSRNQFIIYDDPKYILDNENLDLRGSELLNYVFERHLYSPHYKPLVYLSWAMEKKVVGNKPFLYFFDNLLIHLLNTFWIFWIVILYYKLRGKVDQRSYLIGLGIALFWAIHPLKVESVAWAMERKDVLFGFFFLSSLFCYFYYLKTNRYLWILIGSLLYGAGLLSKSMVLTLPVVLFLVDFVLKRKWSVKLLGEKIPYFIIFGIGLYFYGLFTRLPVFTEGLTEDIVPVADKSFSFITDSNIVNRITFLSFRFFHWITAIIAPHDLAVMYPFPEFIKNGIMPGYLYLFPFLILIIFGLSVFLLKYSRFVLAAVVFFFITIFPVINMPLNESYISDRYTYMPILGFAILFGILVYRIGQIKKLKYKFIFIGMAGSYILFLGISTYIQAGNWKDGTTLFSDIIKKYPDYGRAYMVRAGAREMDHNDLKGAIRDCDSGIEVGPDKLSEAYYDRAGFKLKLKDYAGALADYNLAINKDPGFNHALFNRGIVKNKLGNYKGAIEDFEEALKSNFMVYESNYNIGSNYGILNDTAKALYHLRKCLTINDSDPKVLYNMGLILAKAGNYPKAIGIFTQLLRIDPNHAEALYNRGIAYYYSGELNRGCEDLKKAQQLGSSQAKQMQAKLCNN